MEDQEHLYELLEILEKGVLDLEHESDGDQTTVIHRLFQSAHNLKSGLAMVGLEKASKLFHSLEDGLDSIRRGRESWSSAWSDKILEVIDIVRVCLNEESDESINLDFIKPHDPIKTSRKPLKSKHLNQELKAFNEALLRGEKLYRIEKLFRPGLTRQEYENHMILDDIRSMGNLLSVKPDYDGYSSIEKEIVVRYIFSSTKSAAELEELFFDPLIPMPWNEKTEKTENSQPPINQFKTLIVEDDFTSRLLLQEFLKAYGLPHIAVNGKEAVEAVRAALETGEPYRLICLDIIMPEMDGQTALKQIRKLEENKGIFSTDGAKIIMTTAHGTPEQVQKAFMGLCDGFLVKPVSKMKMEEELRKLGLIP